MMNERSICLNNLVAWLAWSAAIFCVAFDLIADTHGTVGRVGLLFCAAGATLHIKGGIYAMHKREVNAFELGRDSAELHRLH